MLPSAKPLKSGRDTADECRQAHAFIGKFMSDKPISCRKIEQWRKWATTRVLNGSDAYSCSEQIVASWKAMRYVEPPRIVPGLLAELVACLNFVQVDKAKPAQVATVWRGLHRDHPGQDFLSEGLAVFEGMGEKWQDAYAHERRW